MSPGRAPDSSVAPLWQQARGGDFRGASAAARANLARRTPARREVELRLVVAFCAMRQGDHALALRELDAARGRASSLSAAVAARVDAWRAELAYFQGRYSDAHALLDAALPVFQRAREHGYVAFALRIRIAILLARTDYDAAAALADRAVQAAQASGDDYTLVQVLNVLGALHFDRATAKLPTPHARAHLSSLDRAQLAPLEADARRALDCFERARDAATRSGNEFAAWYVAGNIERLEILLGHADRALQPIRRRLRLLHERGATYDAIVCRSNLAWALRSLGRHAEALHELDAAFRQVRETGTGNVLLEFLEYDRSVVLDALGELAAARASYRRYLQLAGASDAARPTVLEHEPPVRRPLEPAYLKRADRYIAEHLAEPLAIGDIARHCGVSERTLEKVFGDFRGQTPVAHIRNLRLDAAHRALAAGPIAIRDVAAAYGFRSATTFALEYRKRFGVPPSRSRRDQGNCGFR